MGAFLVWEYCHGYADGNEVPVTRVFILFAKLIYPCKYSLAEVKRASGMSLDAQIYLVRAYSRSLQADPNTYKQHSGSFSDNIYLGTLPLCVEAVHGAYQLHTYDSRSSG